jgi:hypothetical protein
MEDENIEIKNNFLVGKKKEKQFKKCSKCNHTFPATYEFFYKHSSRKDGLDPWCKECKREYDNKHYKLKNYGITIDEYNKLIEKQNNRCAICGIDFDFLEKVRKYNKVPGTGKPRIDHDHNTGKIRGLLCDDCNTALGIFQENPLILIKAINYIQNHRTNKK